MRKIPPLKTNVFIPQCIYLICLNALCYYCIIVQTVYSSFQALFGLVLFCMNYKCFTDVL